MLLRCHSTDASRERLRELRTQLLDLHKVLLEDTRVAYELDRGRVGTTANLLQLVISDPWFAWLHSLSELIVRIDELLGKDAPSTETDASTLFDHVEKLLTASEIGRGILAALLRGAPASAGGGARSRRRAADAEGATGLDPDLVTHGEPFRARVLSFRLCVRSAHRHPRNVGGRSLDRLACRYDRRAYHRPPPQPGAASSIARSSKVRSAAAVWKIAWPTVLQNAIGGLQGIIDHAMVGHYVGFTGNAAIGVSWQIFLVVIVFIISLFTGMGVLVSRFAGANDHDKVNKVVYQAFLTAFGLSVFILAPIGYFSAPWLLEMINATPEVRAEALPFLRTMFLFSIGMLMFFMLGGALRAAGDARTRPYIGAGMTVLNIALNVILITRRRSDPRVRHAGRRDGDGDRQWHGVVASRCG